MGSCPDRVDPGFAMAGAAGCLVSGATPRGGMAGDAREAGEFTPQFMLDG